MPELYRVTVVARKAKKLQLQLQPTGHALSISLGPSFARMLIEDASAPGHAAYLEWLNAKQALDDDFDDQQAIAQVEVIAAPAEAWPLELAVPFPDDIASLLGAVVLEISVDEAGMIAHLAPDATWHSTAFDELNDGTWFRCAPDDVRSWKRAPKRRALPAAAAPSVAAACRLIECTGEFARVEFVTLGELPGLAAASWLRVLRDAFPGLNVHADYAQKHIASVTIDDVQGAREGKGAVLEWNAETEALRTKGTLHARYRIHASDRAWLARGIAPAHPFATRALGGWTFLDSPSDTALHTPSASSPSDVSNFEELLEMGRMEGRATELEMLADGLLGTREVVLRALEETLKLGEEAVPLAPQIAACTGLRESALATLALECAAAIGAPSLASAVGLATLRLDADVAQAATRALKGFALLPNWMR